MSKKDLDDLIDLLRPHFADLRASEFWSTPIKHFGETARTVKIVRAANRIMGEIGAVRDECLLKAS
jgi:hypothetical protein